MLTGSTNWTPTGLCVQTNNILVLEDKVIAAHISTTGTVSSRTRRNSSGLSHQQRAGAARLSLGAAAAGTTRVWFSPNTKQKTKPKNAAAPVDIAEVFEMIAAASSGCSSCCSSPAAEHPRHTDRRADRGARALRPRRDHPMSRPRSAVTTGRPQQRLRGASHRRRRDPGRLRVLGAGAAQAGRMRSIHDKILVVDPFSTRLRRRHRQPQPRLQGVVLTTTRTWIIRGNRRWPRRTRPTCSTSTTTTSGATNSSSPSSRASR